MHKQGGEVANEGSQWSPDSTLGSIGGTRLGKDRDMLTTVHLVVLMAQGLAKKKGHSMEAHIGTLMAQGSGTVCATAAQSATLLARDVVVTTVHAAAAQSATLMARVSKVMTVDGLRRSKGDGSFDGRHVAALTTQGLAKKKGHLTEAHVGMLMAQDAVKEMVMQMAACSSHVNGARLNKEVGSRSGGALGTGVSRFDSDDSELNGSTLGSVGSLELDKERRRLTRDLDSSALQGKVGCR